MSDEHPEPAVRSPITGRRMSARPHIVVLVGAERFAFPAADVEEVCDAPEIAWAPGANIGFLGTLRQRDRSVSAYDAGLVLGVPREGGFGGALLLRHGASRAAMLVDDVEDLVMVDARWVRRVPGGADADGVLSGVYQAPQRSAGLVSIIRVSSLLSHIDSHISGGQGSIS